MTIHSHSHDLARVLRLRQSVQLTHGLSARVYKPEEGVATMGNRQVMKFDARGSRHGLVLCGVEYLGSTSWIAHVSLLKRKRPPVRAAMDGQGGGFRTRSDQKTPGPSGCEGPGAASSSLQEIPYHILLILSKSF